MLRGRRQLVSAVAAAAIVAVVLLLLPLVVSGHLPPRGLVSGTVAYGRWERTGTYENTLTSWSLSPQALLWS